MDEAESITIHIAPEDIELSNYLQNHFDSAPMRSKGFDGSPDFIIHVLQFSTAATALTASIINLKAASGKSFFKSKGKRGNLTDLSYTDSNK